MKLTTKTTALVLAAAFALGAALGCGGAKRPADLPELQPTKIKIIVDGKGIENANVILQPTEGSAAGKWVPAGTTDASGVAEIKTSGFKGAPVGDYKVVVSANEEIDYGEYGPPPKDDPTALEEWNRKVDPTQFKRYSVVSPEYTNAADSPLDFSVVAGKNETEFDLGAKVREEMEQEAK